MKVVDDLTHRVKKFNFIDMKLAGFASIIVGIIIAKLLPTRWLQTLPYWLLIILAVGCMIRPLYVFFLKKE
jgi:uncharacterized membrane protein YfcA